jgi:hypothetical protein
MSAPKRYRNAAGRCPGECPDMSGTLPLSFSAGAQLFGSIPIRSLTADRMRCLHPRYRSVVWIET